MSLILTITISSNVIGVLAALFFTNPSVQLWSDGVNGKSTVGCNQTPVIGYFKAAKSPLSQIH